MLAHRRALALHLVNFLSLLLIDGIIEYKSHGVASSQIRKILTGLVKTGLVKRGFAKTRGVLLGLRVWGTVETRQVTETFRRGRFSTGDFLSRSGPSISSHIFRRAVSILNFTVAVLVHRPSPCKLVRRTATSPAWISIGAELPGLLARRRSRGYSLLFFFFFLVQIC
jgi:hypothetical protein